MTPKKIENAPKETADWPETSIRRVEADGVTVFYREAGPADAPVLLLLHGFPTSSFQYRELIPRLADRYRVIAPDLPGFGFTEVPAKRQYKYSFDSLVQTILKFNETLGLELYVPENSGPPRLHPIRTRYRAIVSTCKAVNSKRRRSCTHT